MCQIIEALGVKIKRDGDAIDFDTTGFNCHTPPFELVSKLRAAFFSIGPILARLGVAKVPLPGGCSIGARPVELHVRGLQAMGAHVEIEHGIRYALDHEQFLPFFEPQVDLSTGEIIGFEMLARWNHPLSGLILPETFIGVAEEHGLIARLSEHVEARVDHSHIHLA